MVPAFPQDTPDQRAGDRPVSGTLEAAIGILAEQAAALVAGLLLSGCNQFGSGAGLQVPRFALFGTARFKPPRDRGVAGDNSDILEERAGGAIAMMGFLSPAQG
jgi:hypothetical protein